MTISLKVLIVGGYGVFGSRLVRLLEDEPALCLFVSGRSVARADHFIRRRGKTQAQLAPIASWARPGAPSPFDFATCTISAAQSLVKAAARVERGRRLLARLVGAFVGFSKTGADIPVRVQFDAANGIEIWSRKFGGDTFFSRQFAGRGRFERLLCERFGVLTFAMALVVADERLSLILRHWSVFGLPLPMWFGPRSLTYESAEDGRFNFHVRIGHPLTGLIIRHDGWLARKSDPSPG